VHHPMCSRPPERTLAKIDVSFAVDKCEVVNCYHFAL
jgi:hypothetical protein